jgi:hypothetical protein
MTSVINPQLTKALRRAAVRATRAPSVHNTQPWRFVLDGDSLQIHVDPSRQLQVLDPRGSRALVSCGSALFNARVALAASGYRVSVERLPDPSNPHLVARVVIDEVAGPGEAALTRLDPMIDVRRMNRRRFSDEVVPSRVVDALVDAANIEGGEVTPIVRPDDRLATTRLTRLAERIEKTDPAYRAELRAWTSDDSGRWDAVPAHSLPVYAGPYPSRRAGEDRAEGYVGTDAASRLSDRTECLLLVGSIDDTPLAWLRTGEALERVLLEITRSGYTASTRSRVIEVATTNEQLRQQLRLQMHPHALLRVGRAPATPPTRRRRLVDVLTEAK